MSGELSASGRLPVYLLTGFLGAGKTTLLNKALKLPELARTAVLINEFGTIGLDHLLVETADDGVIELSDGCLCCTVRGDFVDTLVDLLEQRGDSFDRIVIEMSGLAEPAPVLQALLGHPVLEDQVEAAGVVCLVDAVNGQKALKEYHEAEHQIALADKVVLTKIDLVEEPEYVLDFLRTKAPNAQLHNARDTAFNLGGLFSGSSVINGGAHGDHHHHHHHHDDDRYKSVTLTLDRPVETSKIDLFIDLLRSAHGAAILRLKGLVWTKEFEDRPLVLHGVGSIFHPPERMDSWPVGEAKTQLVVITDGMDPNFIKRLFDGFMGEAVVDTADNAALTDNPLAVPGVKF